jgi:RHS repeat-associated protein
VQTDYAGVVEKSCQSLPFGDGETCLATPTEHLFTGKERDAESGNDYFGARYYASSVGRWLSPDWSAKVEPVPYAKTDSPQSLNLYAYVGNNPLVGVDLDGHSGVTEGLRMMAENAAPLDPSLWDKKQPPPPPSTTYDPSKTGPEDPTNPGHPLFQNKTFKKLSDKAFVKTDDGKARNGKAEAGFRIDYVDGKLTFGPIITNANETSADGIPNEIPIPIFIGQTIAILHTHGNEAVVEPSSLDERSPVPNFVRSASFLFVTVPNATKDPYIQLQPTPSR